MCVCVYIYIYTYAYIPSSGASLPPFHPTPQRSSQSPLIIILCPVKKEKALRLSSLIWRCPTVRRIPVLERLKCASWNQWQKSYEECLLYKGIGFLNSKLLSEQIKTTANCSRRQNLWKWQLWLQRLPPLRGEHRSWGGPVKNHCSTEMTDQIGKKLARRAGPVHFLNTWGCASPIKPRHSYSNVLWMTTCQPTISAFPGGWRANHHHGMGGLPQQPVYHCRQWRRAVTPWLHPAKVHGPPRTQPALWKPHQSHLIWISDPSSLSTAVLTQHGPQALSSATHEGSWLK